MDNFKDIKWRTHIFIRDYKYEKPANGTDITLLVDLPFSRLTDVERLAKYWTGNLIHTIN